MEVGSAARPVFRIPVAFFARRMEVPRGQTVVTTIRIVSIEFDFSIRALALLLAKGFICFAADPSLK